jgi:hypothetical protein
MALMTMDATASGGWCAFNQRVLETVMILLAVKCATNSDTARRKCPSPIGMIRSRDSSLIDQIGDRLALPAIEPADDGEEKQPKDRHVDHERESI